MIGIDRCALAVTGAAPISPDLVRWYLALGVEMYEVWGMTENLRRSRPSMPAGRHQARHRRQAGARTAK